MSLSVHFGPAIRETLAPTGNKLRFAAFIGAIFASVFVVTLPATIPTIVVAFKKLKADYKQHVAEHTEQANIATRSVTVVDVDANEPIPVFTEALKRIKKGHSVICGHLQKYNAEIKTDESQRQSLELTSQAWSAGESLPVQTKMQIRVPAKFIDGAWDALTHSLRTYRDLPAKASIDIPSFPIRDDEEVLISLHLCPDSNKAVSAATLANLTARSLRDRHIPILFKQVPGEYRVNSLVSIAHTDFPPTEITPQHVAEIKKRDSAFKLSYMLLDQ